MKPQILVLRFGVPFHDTVITDRQLGPHSLRSDVIKHPDKT